METLEGTSTSFFFLVPYSKQTKKPKTYSGLSPHSARLMGPHVVLGVELKSVKCKAHTVLLWYLSGPKTQPFKKSLVAFVLPVRSAASECGVKRGAEQGSWQGFPTRDHRPGTGTAHGQSLGRELCLGCEWWLM